MGCRFDVDDGVCEGDVLGEAMYPGGWGWALGIGALYSFVQGIFLKENRQERDKVK